MGKGASPQCVCLVFARIFSFLSQALSRGISFPDHTDQIEQDVGFYLRRNRFPANPLDVLSVTCLPGPGGQPDQTWWPNNPMDSRQHCFQLRVVEEPRHLQALHGPRIPQSTATVQPPHSRRSRNAFPLDRCGLEAWKWHLLRMVMDVFPGLSILTKHFLSGFR